MTDPEATHTAELLAIGQLLARYGHIMDDAAWDRLGEIFLDDACFDATGVGLDRYAGLGEIRAAFETMVHPVSHHGTNVVIDRSGDRATIRSTWMAVQPDGRVRSGQYRDEARRTEDGWRLASRVLLGAGAAVRRPTPAPGFTSDPDG